MPDYRNYALINLRSGNTGRNFNAINAINVLQIFLLCFLSFPLPLQLSVICICLYFQICYFLHPFFLAVVVKGFAVFLNLKPFSKQHCGKSQISF